MGSRDWKKKVLSLHHGRQDLCCYYAVLSARVICTVRKLLISSSLHLGTQSLHSVFIVRLGAKSTS
jgi:hypothetical protein